MSSKLRKKSKSKPIKKDWEWEQRVSNTDKLIEDSYYNLRLIAYQILHDKFGFGQKRIVKVENTIDEYMREKEKNNLGFIELEKTLKDRCNIDVKAEANQVPFRERFYLTKYKIHAESQRSAGKYLLGSICNFLPCLGFV